jgi:hypothetical protein
MEGTVTISIENYERLLEAEKAINSSFSTSVKLRSYYDFYYNKTWYAAVEKDDIIAQLNTKLEEYHDRAIVAERKLYAIENKTKSWWE